MRRAARIDSNQNDIVEVFRQLGASVFITSSMGGGFVDVVIGCHGKNMLCEIKDGDKPPSARKLTPDEQEFHDNWKGSVCVIETPLDAYQLMREMAL